jgi:hypothetical protein
MIEQATVDLPHADRDTKPTSVHLSCAPIWLGIVLDLFSDVVFSGTERRRVIRSSHQHTKSVEIRTLSSPKQSLHLLCVKRLYLWLGDAW